MKTNEFLDAYVAFTLDAGLSKYSADQYKSYLRNVCKKLKCTDHLDLIAASEDADVQAMYAEQMNAAVTSALKDDSCTVSRKRLHDYKSAVSLLIAYVSELDWTKGKGATAKPVLFTASEYDRRDIRKIFLSRVKTQDRYSYSYGVFAARILCKIAARHKVKLFNGMVDNVKFLIAADKGRFCRLKNVDKLIIATDGHAYIESKGRTYPVYTEVVKNGTGMGYEQANVASMRDLSLDHDIPLYHTLKDTLGSMPEYKKLSDSVKSYKDASAKQNVSSLSINYFNDVYPSLKVCEETLLKEIGAFLDGTQLTVMYTPYNSSKNKNDP